MRSIVKKIISVLLSISFVFVSAFDIIYYKETTVCASSTEQIIYDFITNEMGYNAAVAVGFLANIYRESSFDPHADNGYAYGLIQWEGSRRQDLINYCQNNGYDYTTVNGQLHFMQNELQTTEKKAASKLASITNDENGAYDAGYRICYYYERPANKAWKSNDRGNLAKETYWPMYKDDPTPEEWTEVNAQYIVTTQSTNLSFRTGPNTGYSKVTGYEEGIPKGTEVTVLRINSSGTWAHVSWNGIEGYCSMQYLTKKEDVVIEPTPVYPSQPSLSVSAGTSYGKTTLNWNSCENTNWYDIRIYKSDGTNILTLYNQYTTSYSLPLTTGSYYANIASVNENGNYTFSTDVSFSVSRGTLTPVVRRSYNGHIYAVYDANTWYDHCKQIAEEIMGGHLVTITSAEEDAFVRNLITYGNYEHYWIGGTDTASEGTFNWSTGESMSYTNWTSGEPNNTGGTEHYMEMYKSTGLWNDNSNNCDGTGFVVEIESQTELTSGVYNGNRYTVFESNMTWTEARTYCEMLGGHLAYVNSAEEDAFIYSLTSTGSKGGYWLGGENITRGGTYQWADGTDLTYDNWDTGQADNYDGIEHYLEIWPSGKWNDAPNIESLGFVCEFENTFSKNISVVGKTDTAIEISWTGVMYATGYNVYVDGKKFDTTTDVSYEITGLNPFTSYEIYVEAIADGTSIGTTDVTAVMTAQEVTFSGSGTASDPYLIANEDDLYCMINMVNDPFLNNGFGTKYYQQTADIKMSGDYFAGIGSTDAPFKGIYDGGFHTITGLTAVNGGLFGQVGADGASATIKNLIIRSDVNEMFSSSTGGIAGKLCGNAVIEGCAVIGDVNGVNAGGLVGEMTSGSTIRNCYHNGAVNGEETAGGLVGILTGGNIINSYHTVGSVTGTNAGGLAGTTNETANVQNSFYLKTTASAAASNTTLSGGVAANDVVMKELAETLGDSYASDEEENLNDGYPVFTWQKGFYEFEGSGTAEDPYQINSTEDFIQMADYVNSEMFNSKYGSAYYIQNVDVNLNDMEWTPIGKHWTLPFTGEYDGNSYSIYGLNASGDVYGGLFGRVGADNGDGSGYVHNVTVINGSASCSKSDGKSGGIVGVVAWGARIENCAFIGIVDGANNVGGIAGMISEGGTVKNCYQTGTVTGGTNVGGVVGTVQSGQATIENCYHAGGSVTADSQYGGISGAISSATSVENCYYLKADASYGVNSGSNSGAMAVSSNVLKLLADDLGEVYSENISDYFNEGYPVFSWQDFSKLNNLFYGDINEDEEITVLDAVMLQKYLLAIETFTQDEFLLADLNQDQRVNVFDLVSLKRMLVEGE